jgi:hypothetical protein
MNTLTTVSQKAIAPDRVAFLVITYATAKDESVPQIL